MPKLRQDFSEGVMNKDLDERLVPKGRYRDANNVEVATSEGSNSGIIQNLLGNSSFATDNDMGSFHNYVSGDALTSDYHLTGGLATNSATCICTIAADNRDKIYYFVHSQNNTQTGAALDVRKDCILEYDTIRERIKYVFVDISRVTTTTNGTSPTTTTFYVAAGAGVATNQTGIRVGMQVIGANAVEESDNVRVSDISYDSDKWLITVDTPIALSGNSLVVDFIAEPVLNFTKENIVTGVNVLDDFIYWTDNETEPKKINIKRSIAGTGGVAYLQNAGNGGISAASNNAITDIFQGENSFFHTRLVTANNEDGGNLRVVTNAAGNEVVYVDESHITVIKKSPTKALDLDMYRASAERVNPATGIENPTSAIGTANFTQQSLGELSGLETPATDTVQVILNTAADFRLGDILLFAGFSNSTNDLDETFDDNIRDVRAVVVAVPNIDSGPENIYTGTTNNPYVVSVLSINEGITDNDTEWMIRLEDKDPLFNFKFPRFSYRYKYNDGEYSTFAPFSEVAFLPGNFDYQPKKGHNLGMVNQMRGLKIKGYHPSDGIVPKDVVEIDILYKETNNPTVYTVKTIQPNDGHPLWPDQNNYPLSRGEFELTTDMVHAVVPSNQLLRPYDNVPRKALAQEITANRLVFGNYLQNYSVSSSPKINISVDSNTVATDGFPMPSVKTIRDYHVGVVFSDKYGRETPVLTNKDSTIRISKRESASRNRLKVNLDASSNIPTWAEYYSYYVKETSVPYYTLAQDRWYNAADGNIWLSFPSSERDKIGKDEFLILKKGHGSNLVVQEKAKYKILAIESEAPDFIKTRRVSLGKVQNVDNAIGEAGFGFPMPSYSHVVIKETPFENMYGDELYKERPKNLHLRVWGGTGNRSQFYSITSIAHTDDEDAATSYRITIAEPFGDELGFTTTDGTYATAQDGISVELVEFRVENAPEFDGRFFVKIFKDAALSRYVAATSASEWFVQASWQLGYINNNAYVNAGIYASNSTATTFAPPGFLGEIPEHAILASGLSDSANVDESLEAFGAYSSQFYTVGVDNIRHWTSQGFPHSTQHPTEHNWSNLANYDAASGATGAPYEWLDASDSWFYGDMYDNMTTCSIRGLNGHRPISGVYGGVHNNTYNNTAKKFWKYQVLQQNKFFIDAASAYSWSGSREAIPGSRYSTMQLDPAFGPISLNNIPNAALPSAGQLGNQDYFYGGTNNGANPGNFYSRGPLDTDASNLEGHSDYAISSVPGTINNPAWTAEHMSNTPYDAINNYLSAFSHNHYGNPSRGIWSVGDYSAMDLSWTNFGDSGVPVANYDGEDRPFNLQNAAEVQDGNFLVQGAWEFIQALVEPGTTFRFRNDPDQQVYTVYPFQSPYTDIGYDQEAYYRQPTTYYDGNWGIRNVHSASGMGEQNNGASTGDLFQFADYNRRQRWTILTSPKIGNTLHGYNPVHGTDPETMVPELGVSDPNWRRALKHDNTGTGDVIEIITPYSAFGSHYSDNPGVWETEPKEAAELDIYYQASSLIPFRFSDKTNEEFIPIGSNVEYAQQLLFDEPFVLGQSIIEFGDAFTLAVIGWDGTALQLDGPIQHYNANSLILNSLGGIDTTIVYQAWDTINFNLPNNGSIELTLTTNAVVGDTQLNIDVENLSATPIKLGWNTCWSFGNGVESDRIRDDFNAPQMDNGVKVSATVANPKIKEERRKYGMIWSDIYNSTAGVNNTNQFIAAESITKDLNPSHGSIQALKARDTRLIMFCEDLSLIHI